MAIWDADTNCPLSGQTQDQLGDHAFSCLCGRDRVGRHNAVRDVFRNIARDSCSFAPIKEKPGPLPTGAPDDLSLTHPTLLAGTSAGPPTSGSARGLGLLHLQRPLLLHLVQSRLGLRHRVSACSRPLEVVGPAASASCHAGSPANLVAPPPSPPPTPASLSVSASQQPSTGKTRGRSSNVPLMVSHPTAPASASSPRRGSRPDDSSLIPAASLPSFSFYHFFSFLFLFFSFLFFSPLSCFFSPSSLSPLSSLSSPFPLSPFPWFLPVAGSLARCSVRNFWEEKGPRVHSVMVVAYSWVLTLLWSFAWSPCPTAVPRVFRPCWPLLPVSGVAAAPLVRPLAHPWFFAPYSEGSRGFLLNFSGGTA